LPFIEPLAPSVDLLRLDAMPLRRRDDVPARQRLARNRALLLRAPAAAPNIGLIIYAELSSTAAGTAADYEREKLDAEMLLNKAAYGACLPRA